MHTSPNVDIATGVHPEHPPDCPLAIHDLTVAYQRKPVIWDIELNIPEGKLVGIVGPNGAGKSTLIKACLDLIPATSGWAHVYGQPYKKQRHLVGYVPQRESVDWDFPVSALDVVAMGTYRKLGASRAGASATAAILDEARVRLGLEPIVSSAVRSSSGY